MKSTLKSSKNEKIKFPCLMRWNIPDYNMIILVESQSLGYGKGTVVYSNDPNHRVGNCNLEWKMDNFEYFHGSVFLEND